MPPKRTTAAAAASTRLDSFDALFENVEERGIAERTQYRKLVENIKSAVVREKRRHDDSVWLKYHVIPLGFRGFNMRRCMDFVKVELTDFGFLVQCDLDRNDIHVYWGHIVPKHVRDAMRKQHGVVVDMYGNFVGRELSEEEKQRAANARPSAEMLRKQWEDSEFAQLQGGVYGSAAVQSLHQLYNNAQPATTTTPTPTSTTTTVPVSQYPFLH